MATYPKSWEIEKQLEKKAKEASLDRYIYRELKSEVAKLMDDDEEIGSVMGLEEYIDRYISWTRLVIFTNARLIITKKDKEKIETHIFYYDIKSVNYSDKLFSKNSGTLTIETSSTERFVFEHLHKDQGRQLATLLKRIVAENSSGFSSAEVIVLLEKLGSLKKQGLISEAEFQRQKAKLMRPGH